MNVVDLCFDIAVRAHKDQVDKLGFPYILHPVAVLNKLKSPDQNMICVALLHDVLEDSFFTESYLRVVGVPEQVINSVKILTKQRKESYVNYINRIIDSQDKNAIKIKIADLAHNLSNERYNGVPKNKLELYIGAYQKLTEYASKNND